MDMFEFGVRNQQSMSSMLGDKKAVGSKPLLVFTGSQWDSDRLYGHIQNLLIDFFRGDRIGKISLKGKVCQCFVIFKLLSVTSILTS